MTISRTSCLIVFALLVSCIGVPTVDGPAATGDGGGNDAGLSDADTLDADSGRTVAEEAFRTTDGLVASYSMRTQDPSRVLDDTSNMQHLTLSEAGAGELGKVRTAGGATGTIVPASESIAASGAWTIETWVDFVASRGGDLVNLDTIRLEANGDEITLSASGWSLRADDAFTPGLHHVAATSTGALTRLYIDGFLVDSSVEPLTDDFGDSLTWGGDGFDGVLEHLAIYDRALSHGEIAMHTLVGEEPQEADEQDRRETTFYAWQSRFKRGLAVDAFEVWIAADDSRAAGRIELSSTQRTLQNLALPNPLPGAFVHAAYRHITGDLSDGSSVELYEMLTDWTTNATWTTRNGDAPWDNAGGDGAADRAAAPIGRKTIGYRGLTPGPSYLNFDITEQASKWLDGGYFGWMLTSDSSATNVDSDIESVDSNDEFAGRPSLLFVGSAAVLPPAPMSPVVASAVVVNERDVEIRWTSEAPLTEVYRDGDLYARVSGQTIVMIEPFGATIIQIAHADDFGQVSEPETVMNPR